MIFVVVVSFIMHFMIWHFSKKDGMVNGMLVTIHGIHVLDFVDVSENTQHQVLAFWIFSLIADLILHSFCSI